MLRLLADQSLNGSIVLQVRQKSARADFLAPPEAGLLDAPDEIVLEWAAQNGRVVVASDERTMIGFATARIRAGQPMPGLCHIPQRLGVGRAVRELLTIVECSEQHEWNLQIVHLPL